MPPISAARSVFTRLTLRLEDRPIAASANTSVLPNAGKPYALRFHRSSSSTAACSMRRSTVHRSTRHCRAYAQRPRPDSWPAYLHVLPTCTSVAISPPSHRIVNIRCRQGRAYTGIGCDCRFAARPTSCTSDRPAWARGYGRSAAGLVSPRTRGCMLVGLISGEELNGGNPTLITLRDPSFDNPEKELQENCREISFSADSCVRKSPYCTHDDASGCDITRIWDIAMYSRQ